MPEHTDHLFVVSRRHQYIGRLAVSALLTHDPGTPINELIDDEQPAISVGTPADSVANQFSDHDWVSAPVVDANRSEEHTSELQSLMRISYAVFCLKKKKNRKPNKV